MISIELEPVSETNRVDETALDAAWRRDHESIVSGLCHLLAKTLAIDPSAIDKAIADGDAKGRKPRMTDYGRTLKAVNLVLGTSGYETYLSKSSEMQGDIADNDIVVQAIVKFMAGRTEWSGTMTDLLELLTSSVDANSLKWFPTQPIRLSRRITELNKPLSARGIGWKKSKATKRSITLTRIIEASVDTDEDTDDALTRPVEATIDDFDFDFEQDNDFDTIAGLVLSPVQPIGSDADDRPTSAARQNSQPSQLYRICADCGREATDLRRVGCPLRSICEPCTDLTDDF